MHPTVRPAAAAAAVLGLVLLGSAGCGKAAEKVAEKATEQAIESQGGDDANVDIGSDGQVKIETAEGSYSAGTGEKPKGWPDDVALPDGLEIVTGTDLGGGTETISSIIGTVDDDPASAVAFYEDELSDWEELNRFETSSDGSAMTSLTFTKGDRSVQVTVGQDADGTTTVSVTHSASPAG